MSSNNFLNLCKCVTGAAGAAGERTGVGVFFFNVFLKKLVNFCKCVTGAAAAAAGGRIVAAAAGGRIVAAAAGGRIVAAAAGGRTVTAAAGGRMVAAAAGGRTGMGVFFLNVFFKKPVNFCKLVLGGEAGIYDISESRRAKLTGGGEGGCNWFI
jgi:hypothetical protein